MAVTRNPAQDKTFNQISLCHNLPLGYLTHGPSFNQSVVVHSVVGTVIHLHLAVLSKPELRAVTGKIADIPDFSAVLNFPVTMPDFFHYLLACQYRVSEVTLARVLIRTLICKCRYRHSLSESRNEVNRVSVDECLE